MIAHSPARPWPMPLTPSHYAILTAMLAPALLMAATASLLVSANNRLALCHASRSLVRALGLSWEDLSGKNNGHYAPFAWQNA